MFSYREDPERITYFAETDARGKRARFGIKAKDRSKHIYVIGKTGMGKSTLLENMAIQDIQNGEGVAFIDPHGSTAEKLLDYVPEERVKDVLYFAPFDMEHPIAFNVMEDVGYDKRHLVVSGLMSAFKKIWVDAWSGRMEYILSNTLLALLEYPDSTLLDVNRMYTNKAFRKKVVENIKDPLVKSFWVDEFATYTDRYTQEATPAIQNKVGQFTSNPLIRNIIGQPKSTFDIREMMDSRKIFIANLSKGRMGEVSADLLGSMLTTKIYLSAMSRADLLPPQLAKLPNSYFYVDEFQSIANESFADILSEARKYKLSLTIAHQYIEQMEEHVRNAVFGNVGTTVAFRVGPFDAEVLETIFKPYFVATDLVNLSFAQVYLTLMIDGVGSKPFSAVTLPPIEPPHLSYRDQIIGNSRAVYGRERVGVERGVEERTREIIDEGGGKREEPPRSPKRPREGERVRSPRPFSPRSPEGAGRRLERESDSRREGRSAALRTMPEGKRVAGTLSLKELVSSAEQEARRIHTAQEKKPPPPGSEEHLRELRGTLSRIANKADGGGVKKETVAGANTSVPAPVSPPQRTQQEDSTEAKSDAPPHPNEVPEEMLRRLLDVEKE